MTVMADTRRPDPAVQRGWRSRFAGIRRRERWGYGVWGFVGAVIAVSELWAVAGNPWWLTISATVGHLEQLWSPVKVIVIALIVCGAIQVLRYPLHQDTYPATPGRPERWRTGNGRLTRARAGQARELPFAGWYFPVAVMAVVAAGAAATMLGGSRYVVGYAITGSSRSRS